MRKTAKKAILSGNGQKRQIVGRIPNVATIMESCGFQPDAEARLQMERVASSTMDDIQRLSRLPSGGLSKEDVALLRVQLDAMKFLVSSLSQVFGVRSKGESNNLQINLIARLVEPPIEKGRCITLDVGTPGANYTNSKTSMGEGGNITVPEQGDGGSPTAFDSREDSLNDSLDASLNDSLDASLNDSRDDSPDNVYVDGSVKQFDVSRETICETKSSLEDFEEFG